MGQREEKEMDIGGTFGKVWKKAAMIAIIWAIIAGVLGLIPVVNLIALIITVPLAFIVPALVGYLSSKDLGDKELGAAAITGIISGIVYGLVAGIVGVIFTVIAVVTGIGLSAAGGAGAANTAIAGGVGLVAIIIGVIVGIPASIVIGAILAAIGGILYTVIKK